ncbi:MAG: hypothetical protein WA777_21065 [Rhodanobacter sp.]
MLCEPVLAMQRVQACGLLCESAMQMEVSCLAAGEFLEAAEWADSAERWSRSAFEWAAYA